MEEIVRFAQEVEASLLAQGDPAEVLKTEQSGDDLLGFGTTTIGINRSFEEVMRVASLRKPDS